MNILTVLLYLLLWPILLLNKITWKPADEAHFQQTRKDILDEFAPAERCAMKQADSAQQTREEDRARLWIEW